MSLQYPSTSEPLEEVEREETSAVDEVDVELADIALDADDDEEEDKADAADQRRKRYTKIIVGLILVALVVYIIVDTATAGHVKDGINDFLDWIEDNPISGMFLFTLVYFVATVLFIPGSILTLGAGFVFANAFGLGLGLVIGTISVFIGASSGAIVAFLLGRYLFRSWTEHLTEKYAIFEALDVVLSEKGLRVMTLLRLSPIIPFNVINYICGVTSVSLRDYALANFAILPGTVLFVFLGASAGSLADSASSGDNMTVTIIVVVVGITFGIAAIIVTSVYARRELNRILAERKAAAEEAEEDLAQANNEDEDIEGNHGEEPDDITVDA